MTWTFSLPRHDFVGDREEEDNDGDEIAEAVPDHRPPVEVQDLLGGQGAHSDHQGDVEHGRADNTAHPNVILKMMILQILQKKKGTKNRNLQPETRSFLSTTH